MLPFVFFEFGAVGALNAAMHVATCSRPLSHPIFHSPFPFQVAAALLDDTVLEQRVLDDIVDDSIFDPYDFANHANGKALHVYQLASKGLPDDFIDDYSDSEDVWLGP